jgi:hypothetical protein
MRTEVYQAGFLHCGKAMRNVVVDPTPGGAKFDILGPVNLIELAAHDCSARVCQKSVRTELGNRETAEPPLTIFSGVSAEKVEVSGHSKKPAREVMMVHCFIVAPVRHLG